jgi:N6-L-threonylcarbamoyladenine synthase
MLNQYNFDFSFSGLKTAVKRLVQKEEIPLDVLSREFEDAVVDVLVVKTMKALKKYNVKTLLMGGGVSANKVLRQRLQKECDSLNVDFHVPPIRLCTDNAVYIAGSAFFNNKQKSIEEVRPNPSLGIMDLA